MPGVSGPLPGRRALRARRPGAPCIRARARANDPENIRKASEGKLRNQKKDSADFLSIDAQTNEHGAFRTSSISCPQRCARFFGTSEIGQFIRKPSAIGLRPRMLYCHPPGRPEGMVQVHNNFVLQRGSEQIILDFSCHNSFGDFAL